MGSIITYLSESVIIIGRETSVGSAYHNIMVLRMELLTDVVVACLFYDLGRDLVGQDHPTAIYRLCRRSEISPNGIDFFTFAYSLFTDKCIIKLKNKNILSKKFLFLTLILYTEA